MEKQLRNRFQEIYDRKYNPNTKGYDYERILGNFLEDYLGGAYNFNIRVGVIDNELKVNSVFSKKENEFDIVATYKSATPKIIHQRLIPYDSVAFIVEAKQTVKVSEDNLIHDLEKFERLSELEVSKERFSNQNINPYRFAINRPLRILFYYKQSVDPQKFFDTLTKYKAWDVCIILKENEIVLNSTLPYFKEEIKKKHPEAKTARLIGYPLLKGIFFTSAFIKNSFVDSWRLYGNLLRIVEQNQK